jgi:hypothetical protein
MNAACSVGAGCAVAGFAGWVVWREPAVSGVNIEGLGRDLARLRCAAFTALCSSVPLVRQVSLAVLVN